MNFVTPAHVRQLAEAEFSDLPVLAIDVDGEIEVFPQSTAEARGATILTDAAALLDYTDGGELDDVLAAQFAQELNQAHDLVDDTEDTDDTTGENPMRLVNLTPHPVTLVTANGDEVVIQPEETPARIPTTTTPAGDVNGIPLVVEQLGDANSVLPTPQPDTVYIVARPVAERANRPDLVVPTNVERVNGRPVRARALARVAASSPRATAADAIIRVAETAVTEDKDRRTGLELLEVAAEVRRGSVNAFRDGVRQLTALEQMQFISAQLRAETRAALAALQGLESAYKADVQNNPPSCRPCGGYGEIPVDDVTSPIACGECGGTGREQAA
ncbi:hypothetical protein P1312_051 [Thermobifida phage P1312]|nr:hypothetical protein P1312_051 [Thermobifida phage P1312]